MFDLYVAGTTPKSIFIFNNLNQICSEYLQNECRIRIIDLLKTPAAAKRDQIVAISTLVRTQPLPARDKISAIRPITRPFSLTRREGHVKSYLCLV